MTLRDIIDARGYLASKSHGFYFGFGWVLFTQRSEKFFTKLILTTVLIKELLRYIEHFVPSVNQIECSPTWRVYHAINFHGVYNLSEHNKVCNYRKKC